MKKVRNGFIKKFSLHCLIGVIALGLMTIIVTGCAGSDGDGDGGETSANTPPTATITSPSDGSIYTEGDTITFTGTGGGC